MRHCPTLPRPRQVDDKSTKSIGAGLIRVSADLAHLHHRHSGESRKVVEHRSLQPNLECARKPVSRHLTIAGCGPKYRLFPNEDPLDQVAPMLRPLIDPFGRRVSYLRVSV